MAKAKDHYNLKCCSVFLDCVLQSRQHIATLPDACFEILKLFKRLRLVRLKRKETLFPGKMRFEINLSLSKKFKLFFVINAKHLESN